MLTEPKKTTKEMGERNEYIMLILAAVSLSGANASAVVESVGIGSV